MEASKRRVVLGNLVGVSENQGYLILGVLIMILLFRKLYWGPLFSETPLCRLTQVSADLALS